MDILNSNVNTGGSHFAGRFACRQSLMARSRALDHKLSAVILFCLLITRPAFGQLNFGLSSSWPTSVTQQALKGFSQTKFKARHAAYRGAVAYRFRNNFTLEVAAEKLELGISENGADFGTVRLTPIQVLVKGQAVPAKGKGFGGHGHVGAGVALGRFYKGPAITAIERQFGAQVVTEIKRSAIGEFGAGLDYFFDRHFALTTDFRFQLGNVGISQMAVGRRAVPIEGVEVLRASNFQIALGFRIWAH